MPRAHAASLDRATSQVLTVFRRCSAADDGQMAIPFSTCALQLDLLHRSRIAAHHDRMMMRSRT